MKRIVLHSWIESRTYRFPRSDHSLVRRTLPKTIVAPDRFYQANISLKKEQESSAASKVTSQFRTVSSSAYNRAIQSLIMHVGRLLESHWKREVKEP